MYIKRLSHCGELMRIHGLRFYHLGFIPEIVLWEVYYQDLSLGGIYHMELTNTSCYLE